MIITKTPFRVSFFGGGTDYPAWYEKHGGTVLSTTIDKYCYISTRYLPPFFDHKYRIRYTKREEVKTIDEIEHPKVREGLNLLNVKRGIEMIHSSDIPAMSGMGSSSAFTVGFLHALHALEGRMVSKHDLALRAILLEQDIIKENVGSQDQVSAAFGGFNQIEFRGRHSISVNPITIASERQEELEKNLMLFFTGLPREASEIAREQIANIPKKQEELEIMKKMVDRAAELLHDSRKPLDDFGRLLHETWTVKKNLSSKITNPEIDEIYAAGMRSGALGGKLLGAGGGGMMLFYVPSESHKKVREVLRHLIHIPFRFERLGSQVVYYDPKADLPVE